MSLNFSRDGSRPTPKSSRSTAQRVETRPDLVSTGEMDQGSPIQGNLLKVVDQFFTIEIGFRKLLANHRVLESDFACELVTDKI